MSTHFVHTSDVETVFFFRVRMRVLMSGAQTGGAFCLIEVRSPAGAVVPPHVHRRETETIHVLEGTMICATEGRRIAVGPGEKA